MINIIIWIVIAATSFYAGTKVANNARDAIELKATRAAEVVTRYVNRKSIVIEKVYVDREVKIAAVQEAVNTEIVTHATSLADPTECYLDVERVRTINRAWGVDADKRDGDAAVPAPDTTLKRESPGRGDVGLEDGPAVPALPSDPPAANRTGTAAGTSGRG